MRLSCALVCSFLFVTAVPANYHSEKQQPPFLSRVEKPINSATLIPLTKWTGSAWTIHSVTESTDFAACSFAVPTAQSTYIGSGFNLAVGIKSSGEDSITLAAGITVTLVSEGISYEAWGGWGDTKIVAEEFPIRPGQEIGALVQLYSLTTGVAALIDFATGRTWATVVSGGAITPVRDAGWVMTVLPGYFDAPLPNFHSVSLTYIEAHIHGGYKAPDRTEIVTNAIEENGRTVTSVVAYQDFLVIVYIPEP